MTEKGSFLWNNFDRERGHFRLKTREGDHLEKRSLRQRMDLFDRQEIALKFDREEIT